MTTPTDAARGTVPEEPSSAPPAEKASVFEDFIDVFYAPSSVYARREKQSWWPHFWILTAVGAILVFASRSLISAVFDAEFTRNVAKAMAENPRITEDMMRQQRGISETLAMVGSFLGMPLLIVLGAVLIWIGARIMSARISFDRAMLVAAIAQIPRLLGSLLTAIYAILITDTSSIEGMHSLSYSPARFLDPGAVPAPLLGFLARFDVFTLWVTVLMGIGVAVLARVPRGRGLAAAAIAWAIPTLFTLAGFLWS
jgi:uncharacterized protein YneF (UPF0154 family)